MSIALLLSLLASLLWQQDAVDVGQNTTSSNGHTAEQLAQLLIVAHCQLDVAGHNAGLLVVTGSVACQLKHLSCKVLQNCCLQQKHKLLNKLVLLAELTRLPDHDLATCISASSAAFSS